MTQDDHIHRIQEALHRPIILVGMPASGKTSLGQGLTNHLGFPFIDTDRVIESTAGRKIAEIFEVDGESAFRDLEASVIRKVFTDNPGACIVSTGGGSVIRDENAELLFGRTCSIWVRASVPVLLQRTAKDIHRPLLRNSDPEQVLRNLESARHVLYRKADIVIDTDDRLPEQIVPEILAKIVERL